MSLESEGERLCHKREGGGDIMSLERKGGEIMSVKRQ